MLTQFIKQYSCDPSRYPDEDQTRRRKGIVEARLAEANGGDAVFSVSPSLTTTGVNKNPIASDIYKIRMLTQLTASGDMVYSDPDGQCKGIRDAKIPKATGGGAIMK